VDLEEELLVGGLQELQILPHQVHVLLSRVYSRQHYVVHTYQCRLKVGVDLPVGFINYINRLKGLVSRDIKFLSSLRYTTEQTQKCHFFYIAKTKLMRKERKSVCNPKVSLAPRSSK
jgi:hypothetical protein